MKQRRLTSLVNYSKLTACAKAVGLCVLGSLWVSGSVHAATIRVTSSSDSASTSECTLRKAIESFNSTVIAQGCFNLTAEPFRINDTILFSSALAANKITLAGEQLNISTAGGALNIDASSIGGITIDANRNSRVAGIFASVVSFNNIALTGGSVDIDGDGGALEVRFSTVTLNNSSVIDNETRGTQYFGGGGGEGGGIAASAYSSITLNNSSVDGNRALSPLGAFGGGIGIRGGDLTLNNSTLSNNISMGSAGQGGGINAINTHVVINNSTLSNNESHTPLLVGHAMSGGGPFILNHSTIVNTELVPNEFEPFFRNTIILAAGLAITNSIVSTNFGITCSQATAAPTLDGVNLSTDGHCGMQSAEINLGKLSDNGCQVKHATPSGLECVKTHALLENSTAIDAVGETTAFRDQRGVSRPFGIADVGAYEVGSFTAIESDEEFFVVPLANGKSVFFGL